MYKTYTVTWSINFDASSPESALRQAWATLDDAVNRREGATIITINQVGYDDDKDYLYYDMERTGFCDFCDTTYDVASNSDHCGECGNCLKHCLKRSACFKNRNSCFSDLENCCTEDGLCESDLEGCCMGVKDD
jgi:hypothetical protein